MAIKISALTAGSALLGTELFESVQSGASVKITADQIKAHSAQEYITFRSVVNGFTETFGTLDDVMILNNAGTVAAGTVTMPATPLDGRVVHISSAMNVNALTVAPNTGQAVVGLPTNITSTTPVGFVYRSANATWYRII